MSKKYATNGGPYLYCKNIFNSKVGYYAGFYQYIQAPLVAVSTFFGMLWAFLGTHIGSNGSLENIWWVGIIAAALFSGSYLITAYGFFATKWSLFILWALKWGIIIFSIIMAFISIADFNKNIFHNGANVSHIQVIEVIQAIITFFFAFGGIEGIAIVSEDIEEPDKNMPRVLILIVCLATLFYLFYFYVILGSLGAAIDPNSLYATFKNGDGSIPNLNSNQGTDFNPINQLLTKGLGSKFGNLDFAAGGIVTFIITLLVLSQLANKTTARMMNSWVNARMLATIAEDGFLPVEFSYKTKYNQFKRTLVLDAFISFILIIIFYPIYLITHYNIADAVDLYTVSAFFQYIFVLLAVIKLWKITKKSKIKIYEIFAYISMLFIILFLLLSYFISGIQGGITAISSHNASLDNIGVFITTLTYIFLTLFAIFLYYFGKYRGWHDKGVKHPVDFSHHHDLLDIQSQTNL